MCIYIYIYIYIDSIEIHEIYSIWGFPKMGIPQNGGFIRENPIKMDDLGVPLFQETTIYIYIYICIYILLGTMIIYIFGMLVRGVP